jgi:cytidyltransferase-like protein|tara:strand:- start:272 stop:718 length:447 start_codon:yes stop_codon:yes gene_type:complete
MSKKENDTVVVSGGFDPIHVGHVRMIREAAEYGLVVVVANSDDWLYRKKGYNFMGFVERKEILMAIKGVIDVIPVNDKDGTVCAAIRSLHPTYFANGGDRTSTNTPEKEVCEELGIKMLWNIGGQKIQSSSELVKASDYLDSRVLNQS